MLTERPGPALREMIHAGSIHMECNNNSSRSAVAYITRMAKANEQKDIKCNTPSDTHSQREKRQDTHFYLPVFSCSFSFFFFFHDSFSSLAFLISPPTETPWKKKLKRDLYRLREAAAQPRIYSAGSNQFCEYDQASAVHPPILCLYSCCCCCWVKNFVPSSFPRLLFSTSLITERRRRLLD